MQNIVRKLVAVAHHPHRHRIFHTGGVHSVFSSALKSSQRIHNILPNSLLITHPLHHFTHSTTSPSLCRTLLLRCRPNAHYFRGHNFNFNHSYHSCRRSLRSWLPGLTPNDMVLALIITNVGVFLLWGMADEKFMIKNFTISLDNFNSGHLHTLITNAFSHRNTFHIFSNMIGLYFFGRNDWRAMIASKELALGASGAVNAVMLLDIFLFPKATLYLNFFVPVPAVLLGIFLIGKDMLRILEGNSQISASAHLGGAAVAAIAWAGVRKGRF